MNFKGHTDKNCAEKIVIHTPQESLYTVYQQWVSYKSHLQLTTFHALTG